MARMKADREYRSFIKGLITEASGLTYPESSCRDLDNVDINTDGSVRRRLGIIQERDGVVVGAGDLADTTFANNTGGPLSLAPSVFAETLTKDYPSTSTVDPLGDWTLGGSNTGPGVEINGFQFRLYADRGGGQPFGRHGYVAQDLNLNDYDEVTITWVQGADDGRAVHFHAKIGVDSSGVGQSIRAAQDGLFLDTLSTRPIGTNDTEHSNNQLWAGEDLTNSYRYYLSLAKIATNTYSGSIRINRVDNNQLVATVAIPAIGMTGGFLEFQAQSGYTNTSTWDLKDISIVARIAEVDSDLPDVTLDQRLFAISTHTWSAPGADGTKNFQVFQIGNTLYFRDAEQETVSNPDGTDVPALFARLPFDGVGTGLLYNHSSSTAARIKLQSASGNGRIYFTSKAVVPFYAELIEEGTRIRLRACGVEDNFAGVEAVTGRRTIRDFVGVEDGLDNDETPAAITKEHLYNLLNQGWPSARIQDYFSSQANYPSNAQQWFLGKQADDSFDPALLILQDFGMSQAARGRILLDALLGERDGIPHSVSALASPLLFDEEQDLKASTGWETVAFYAGRVWLAGEVNVKRPSCVYFSKTLESASDSGKFYQLSDPTSEHFSDLLATDGGYIPIPEAGSIRRLVPYGSGLLVMADTGIWFVYGREGGFTANTFSVEKITSTGITGPNTVVPTDLAVYFWADNSIHRVVYSQNNAGLPSVEDLGETTIFKLYQLISLPARENASSAYDPISKRVFWFWMEDEQDAERYTSAYNKALIFDTRTGAFTTYSFHWEDDPLLAVAGGFARQTPTRPVILEPVYDSTGEDVVDSLDAVVVGPDPAPGLSPADLTNSLKLVIVSEADKGLRLAEFGSLNFGDFDNFGSFTPVESQSYVVTGDETVGDLQRKKQATYVHSFFLRTERGFYTDSTPKRPSGCKMYARWDWHNTGSGGRWSAPQTAYRPGRRAYAPGDINSDTFDTGEEIVYTQLKVRGQGRAMALRYESVAGKDFRLLGISIPVTVEAV